MFGWFVSSFYISKVTKTNLIHVGTKMCSFWLKNRIGFIFVFQIVHTFSFSLRSLWVMSKTDIIGQRSTHFLKRLQQFILLLVKLVLRHVMFVLISELENTKMQLLRHFIRTHICRFIAYSLSLVPCMFVLAICKLLAVIVRKYINSKRGMCSVLFDPLDTSYWLEQSLQRNAM